jgi:uncharacterized membrane protein (UPF0127 family)
MSNDMLKYRIIAGVLTLMIVAAGAGIVVKCAGSEEYKSGLPVEKLVIETAAGAKPAFDVEVAVKPMDVQIGLMFRKEMAKDHGMLFELGPESKPTSFWMKNTLIPLDMLFVAEGGRIVNIRRNALPEDLTPIPSLEPVMGVIEINGGLADSLGIKIGDRVVHPYFQE